MIGRRTTGAGAAALAVALAWAGAASAQATRTWVSGVGDDANPCSRTAPCKTFAGAISKTAAGGEINCLDPGAYGALTITKSISIVCQYTQAGVLATLSSNGFTINAGATDVVFLSGLDINGAGTGGIGIRILAAGSVHVQDSAIYGFRGGSALGVSIAPGAATQVTITDTTITNNGTGATGGGIRIQPTGAAGSARVTLRNVSIRNNAATALRVDTTGNTGPGVSLFVDDSQVLGSTNGIDILAPVGTTSVQGVVTDTLIALNTTVGFRANGSTIAMRVANLDITGNGTGVIRQNSGGIQSYGTSRLDGNTTDGSFSQPVIPQE